MVRCTSIWPMLILELGYPKNALNILKDMGGSINMGVPINGWFISWKIPFINWMI
jgi:hypothetical protein